MSGNKTVIRGSIVSGREGILLTAQKEPSVFVPLRPAAAAFSTDFSASLTTCAFSIRRTNALYCSMPNSAHAFAQVMSHNSKYSISLSFATVLAMYFRYPL